jgi:hypothetical protein
MQLLNATTVTGLPPKPIGEGSRGADFDGVPPLKAPKPIEV